MKQLLVNKKWLISYAIVFVIGILPIISVLSAMILSSLVGCGDVNEGSAPDCTFGEYIYVMFVMGWLGLVTIPLGIAGLIILLIAHAIWIVVQIRKR